MSANSEQYTVRDVSLRRAVQEGYQAGVTLFTREPHEHGGARTVDREAIGTYCFALVSEVAGRVDEVRGDVVELAEAVDGEPVIYIGNSFSKHYWKSRDHEGSTVVPIDVLEALEAEGLTLVADVDGGWVSWEGRPEWSDRYLDVEEAEPVDVDALAEERGGA